MQDASQNKNYSRLLYAGGIILTGLFLFITVISFSAEEALGATTVGSNISTDGDLTITGNTSLGNSTSDTLTIQGATTLSISGSDSLNILTGNLKVGNGSPGVALNGEDAYVEGTFEIDGSSQFDGAVTINGTANIGDNGDTITISGTTITFTANSAGNDITGNLVDNNTDAFDIQEGTNNYLNINTTNSSETISFGNTNTNPAYSFLGSGTLTANGNLTVAGTTTLNGIANIGDNSDAITISGTTITFTANSAGNDVTVNLVDNNTNALLIQEGSSPYITINTTNSVESIMVGSSSLAADLFLSAGPGKTATLQATTATVTNGNGGAVTITSGASNGTGSAGNITLTAGRSASTGGNQTGGAILLTAGDGGGTSGNGGPVTITAGAASAGNSNGGDASLNGGAGQGTGTGGGATIAAGTGGATGAGGGVAVTGGAGGATSGAGGLVTITGGTPQGGNSNGGNVRINGGNATGTGVDGTVLIGNSNTSTVELSVSSAGTNVGIRFNARVITLKPDANVAGCDSANLTLTARNIFDSGVILCNPSATRTITTPTAANIVAGIPATASVGDFFSFVIVNSNGTNGLTLEGGTGVTFPGSTSVPASSTREVFCRVTAVTGGSEAVTCY